MPGLLRHKASAECPAVVTDTTTDSATTPLGTKGTASPSILKYLLATACPSHTMASGIRYIPCQTDVLAGASVQTVRENLFHLTLRDLGVMVTKLPYLPLLVLPFRTKDKHAELYLNFGGIRDMMLQITLGAIGIFVVLCFPIVYFILPGGIMLITALVVVLVIYLIAWPMQGPRIVLSAMDETTSASAREHTSERWVFINGINTGNRGLQANVNRIAKVFGRPVIGVHNRSYGTIADLLECLVQRCWPYSTPDVRFVFDYLKAYLADPTVERVILIAHSQGGIIASMVLDSLFTDLPREAISKLEVYTFGSAAAHFNNPRRTLSGRSPAAPSSERCIPHMEHYVNELDMVSRWGVLHNIEQVHPNRYSGKVFIRLGATGHFFNQHYLDPMFPLNHSLASRFLDQVVHVDEKLANRRENEAVVQLGAMRRESRLTMDVGSGVGRNGKEAREEILAEVERMPRLAAVMDGGLDVLVGLEETTAGLRSARGKTVRQLSRLWRYVDGGSPLLAPM